MTMRLSAGDYTLVSGSRPTCFSVYKDDEWITSATLVKGVLKGVEDNPKFSKKDAKLIRKVIVDNI